MRTAVVLALLLASVLRAAPGWKSFSATRVSTGRVLLEYTTGHDDAVVGQIDGLDLATSRGIELTIRSEFPTQLRLYLVSGGAPSPARFRYVVFSRTMLEQKLVLPLSSFDPDPRAVSCTTPSAGTLVIRDCPGMLRSRLANRLAVGPLAMLAGAPPVPADEIAPGPEAERDPAFGRILGGWIGKVAGGELGMPREGSLSRDASVIQTIQNGLPDSTWGFGPDDDSSFEVLHLIAAREAGPGLTSQDLIRAWVRRFSPEFLWQQTSHQRAGCDNRVDSGELHGC